ncbi:MAG: hypothetical protein AUJ56_08005 [Zetaproteobacteria bacterium CG1_02_49_23]|nr:MAG: hypothetical protein AUJ56_08005 [Zetaproteobacteria bacterium CG1_02_49_23]
MITQDDHAFLAYVEKYIKDRPEVGAHVADFVSRGIELSRKDQVAKSADMEVIISFLLRGGKLKDADKEFVSAKLEKWNKLCSLNWDSLLTEWKTKCK